MNERHFEVKIHKSGKKQDFELGKLMTRWENVTNFKIWTVF